VREGHLDWTTDRPGVATVTGEGAVTAVVPGHAVVTAWAPWGKTASADVFVTGDLLVSSNRAGHGFGIYQLRMTAPDTLLPVLTDTAANVQAVWSPDRSRIAFSSNRAGDYDLELADADGGNRRVLSAGTGVDGEPVWSPDGTRLVFASARGGAAQLYSVGIDGGDLRQLTASPGASTSPAFSPDGHTIAFVSSRDGGYEIYLMDADGGNQRRITHTDSRELAPRFFPGGDLAWVVDRGAREGSAIVRQTGPSSLATVVSAPASILSWSLARDGATIAYVTGRITSAAANRTAFSLVLQPVAGGPPVPVRLGPAEQPVTPAF
jgi:Tol biopolymer transport system component